MMAGGRRWTEAEDEAIREAAAGNRGGIVANPKAMKRHAYFRRLEAVAVKLGRTYGAVRCRAHRIGARSYGRRLPGMER